ncbi:protein BUNDLE SHEATH DEFECTIVE 2, chloroplastic [Aristolochia californica]|uniref:protein BUNDLE SHEATH DEFECTIVE 2, chloroplastic n=1 Tax=Aristolochia californica TaxID=171875 RepID=UPI0035DEE6D2
MASIFHVTSVNSIKSFTAFLGAGLVVSSDAQKRPWVRVGVKTSKLSRVVAKAADSNQSKTKPRSIVCADCDGNGAILCTQCEGTGVNSVDHFNGQFKAGGLCWLCRGKREILCGSCNGAGFLGGFMSSFED